MLKSQLCSTGAQSWQSGRRKGGLGDTQVEEDGFCVNRVRQDLLEGGACGLGLENGILFQGMMKA